MMAHDVESERTFGECLDYDDLDDDDDDVDKYPRRVRYLRRTLDDRVRN